MAEAPDDSAEVDRERQRLAVFVLGLRARGIHDNKVLSAIESTTRRLFLPAVSHGNAFDDRAIGIECGQTISAVSMVALMMQEARLAPGQRVLDVGTGSGFAAAVAARLVAQVYTVDRYKTLVDLARDRFLALKLHNVICECRDGLDGWADQAPFDRILVSAAATEIPPALLRQLASGGIMIVPVGAAGGSQALMRISIDPVSHAVREERLADARFVPLVPGRAGNL